MDLTAGVSGGEGSFDLVSEGSAVFDAPAVTLSTRISILLFALVSLGRFECRPRALRLSLAISVFPVPPTPLLALSFDEVGFFAIALRETRQAQPVASIRNNLVIMFGFYGFGDAKRGETHLRGL